MTTTAAPKKKRRQKRGPRVDVMHNVHFCPNTSDVLVLHSSLTKSGGISPFIRVVMEYFLATTINWDDPRYSEVEKIPIPRERYPGQFARLGIPG